MHFFVQKLKKMESLYFKDWLIAKNLLEHIEKSVRLILERTDSVSTCNDFLDSPSGMEKLDAVCMQLIAIGESVNKLDKVTSKQLLISEPDIPWSSIKGVRNFIAHDYFDVDVEEIFHIIKTDLHPLLEAIIRLQKNINHNRDRINSCS